MGLLNKGSVTYFSALYSKSGFAVWRDEFEVRNDQLMNSNGLLGPNFSWSSPLANGYKKDAEQAGFDIADKLEHWLARSKKAPNSPASESGELVK